MLCYVWSERRLVIEIVKGMLRMLCRIMDARRLTKDIYNAGVKRTVGKEIP